MVKRCVIGSCNNSNKNRAFYSFLFPKEERIRRQWIKFVQVKRADFLQLTEHFIICGTHFAPECFENEGMVKMGLKDKRSNLKSDSVPTINPSDPKHSPKRLSGLWRVKKKKDRRLRLQTPGKRSRTIRAVHKLSVSRVSKPT